MDEELLMLSPSDFGSLLLGLAFRRMKLFFDDEFFLTVLFDFLEVVFLLAIVGFIAQRSFSDCFSSLEM